MSPVRNPRPSKRTPSPQTWSNRTGKSSTDPQIRLLIADDHEVVRQGLAAMVTGQPDMRVVAEAPHGRLAVQLWQQHRPDVSLLDLRMPEMDGMGVLLEIRRQDASARAIMLTTFDCDEDIYRAVREGAKAYLLKDASRDELLACIRKVAAGETYFPPAIVAKLATRMSGGELTGRELEVLTLLAKGRSNKEIGGSLFISETTVKSHVKSLFAKLQVLSRTEAIAVATRRGLIRF
ncbi:MAG: response regulator transcription factor [Candidatus Omnitrophica bacterium]|nr:response regulator transcription factor [Candidatus Omnitrophota bacterium]